MATEKAIIYKGIPYFSNVKVPTRVSQLANDAGYVTSDEKVKQTPNTTSMDSHPILFSASDSSGEVVGGAYKNSNFYYRPDANHLIFKNGGGIEISSGTTGISVLSQYIRLTDLDEDHSIMNITTNDIELENVTSQGTTYSNTWDGTHHSLKTSIRSLVSKSGDTISGDYINTADFSEGGVTGKRVTTYGPWGIDVEEYVGTSLWSRLSLRDSDILLTKTWDGTHTSLKQAITYFYTDLLQIKSLGYKNNLNLTAASDDKGTISLCTYTYQTSNTPQVNTAGFCFTFINSDSERYGAQIAISNGGIYWRPKVSGSWNQWLTL